MLEDGVNFRARMVVTTPTSVMAVKRSQRAFSTCGIDRDPRQVAFRKLLEDAQRLVLSVVNAESDSDAEMRDNGSDTPLGKEF